MNNFEKLLANMQETKPATERLPREPSNSPVIKTEVITSNPKEETSSFSNLMKAMGELAIKEEAEATDEEKELARRIEEETEPTTTSLSAGDGQVEKLYKSIPFENLDPSQQHAVNSIVNQKYSLLIGYAGTGKSTTVDNVIKKLEERDVIGEAPIGKLKKLPEDVSGLNLIPKIAFCSYTGRATQQLRNKLPDKYAKDNCMTVHKLLGYYPEYFEEWNNEKNQLDTKRIFIPFFGNTGPELNYDVIVIDEAGMLPAKLWNELLKALPPTCRLILAGDSAQLPPIHGLSPLGLLLSYWPTYELTKIHRTDNTELVDSAQLIRQGKTFPIEGPSVRSMKIDKYPQVAYKQTLAAVKKLFDEGTFDPEQDIIVTTTNVGLLGQENLNKTLRKICNPNSTPIIINAVRERKKLAIGDKVMSVSNDYELGITNGMFGTIVDIVANDKYQGGSNLGMNDILSIDFSLENTSMKKEDKLAVSEQASHICVVHFPESFADDKYVNFSTSGGYSNFQLAYACTCHKVQGGEYRNVMIVCHRDKAGRLLNREWLYTAWTRSKSNIFLLYTPAALATALGRQALKGRTLADKAKWIRNKYAEKIAGGYDEHFPQSLQPEEITQ